MTQVNDKDKDKICPIPPRTNHATNDGQSFIVGINR